MKLGIKKAPSNRGLRPSKDICYSSVGQNQKSPIKSGIKTITNTPPYVTCAIQKSPIKSGIKTYQSGCFSGNSQFKKAPSNRGLRPANAPVS